MKRSPRPDLLVGRHAEARPRRPRRASSRTTSLSRSPSSVRGLCSPGCRRAPAARPARCTMPRTACRVVCGRLLVIATLLPTRALVSVDLPALGRPTRQANPGVRDRCMPASLRHRLRRRGGLADGRRRGRPHSTGTSAPNSARTPTASSRAAASPTSTAASKLRAPLDAPPRRRPRSAVTGQRRGRRSDGGRGVGAAVGVADRGALGTGVRRVGPQPRGPGQGDDLGVLGVERGHAESPAGYRPRRRARASRLTSISSRRRGAPARCRSGCGARRSLSAVEPQPGDLAPRRRGSAPGRARWPAGRRRSRPRRRSELDAEQLVEVLDRQPGGRPGPCPSSSRSTGGGLAVVLVGDLADDLLEDVLDGDQARGAAVLVDDDRDVAGARPASRAAARRPAWSRARRPAGRIDRSTCSVDSPARRRSRGGPGP